jgi:hypothetical protein
MGDNRLITVAKVVLTTPL